MNDVDLKSENIELKAALEDVNEELSFLKELYKDRLTDKCFDLIKYYEECDREHDGLLLGDVYSSRILGICELLASMGFDSLVELYLEDETKLEEVLSNRQQNNTDRLKNILKSKILKTEEDLAVSIRGGAPTGAIHAELDLLYELEEEFGFK